MVEVANIRAFEDRPALAEAVFLLPGGRRRMAKRGRPRKNGARYSNGHLKPPQDQIPEGIAMRRVAVLELSGAARDQRASYPLGVCEARHLVLKVEHGAGDAFQRLHS